MKKKEGYIGNSFVNIYSLIQKNLNFKKIKMIMYYIDRILVIFTNKPKHEQEEKRKILVIFNLALGDAVIFINSLNNIRSIYPKNEYELTLTCQKGLEKIYSKSNIFDKIIPLNYTKATVNLKERYLNIKQLRNEYYDIVLDPVGANDCSTNVLMTRIVCAKQKIGCLINSMDIVCSKHILNKTYTEKKQIKEKALIGQYYEYFYEEYKIKYYHLPKEKVKIKLPKKYYIVFPGASLELKRWSVEKYAEIVKRIYKKTKLPLLLCGTEVDRSYYEELIKLIDYIPYINIIGQTSLLEFIDVIDKASFVITNDTSTYHIAVISETPVAIITGGYTYDRYVAYNFKGNEKYKKPYIIVDKMKCFNCQNNCTKINSGDKVWPCLNNITVDYAWKIINKMIEDSESSC